MLRNKGMLHVYAELGSGMFLGAEMLGPEAEHIGHLLAWALQMKLTIAQMLEMPFYQPVLEEGLRGSGGHLLDGAMRRFMADYDKEQERALEVLQFKLDILWAMNDAMAQKYGVTSGVTA